MWLIGQRTREGLAAKRAAGVRLGRPSVLPAEVVSRIVIEHRAGASLRAIAVGLTEAGVPTACGGGVWRVSAVRAVLNGRVRRCSLRRADPGWVRAVSGDAEWPHLLRAQAGPFDASWTDTASSRLSVPGQLGNRLTLATTQVAGPGLASLTALPLAFIPLRVTDWPAASELLTTLISPIRVPLALLTLMVVR